MTNAIYNFELYQGNDDIYVLKIEETDNDGNKINANLTNCSFILSIKDTYISSDKIVLSSENGDIQTGVLDSSSNFSASDQNPYALKIHFSHELTEKMVQPKYVYDLFSIKFNGIRELLIKGDIKVTQGVTYGRVDTPHY